MCVALDGWSRTTNSVPLASIDQLGALQHWALAHTDTAQRGLGSSPQYAHWLCDRIEVTLCCAWVLRADWRSLVDSVACSTESAAPSVGTPRLDLPCQRATQCFIVCWAERPSRAGGQTLDKPPNNETPLGLFSPYVCYHRNWWRWNCHAATSLSKSSLLSNNIARLWGDVLRAFGIRPRDHKRKKWCGEPDGGSAPHRSSITQNTLRWRVAMQVPRAIQTVAPAVQGTYSTWRRHTATLPRQGWERARMANTPSNGADAAFLWKQELASSQRRVTFVQRTSTQAAPEGRSRERSESLSSTIQRPPSMRERTHSLSKPRQGTLWARHKHLSCLRGAGPGEANWKWTNTKKLPCVSWIWRSECPRAADILITPIVKVEPHSGRLVSTTLLPQAVII